MCMYVCINTYVYVRMYVCMNTYVCSSKVICIVTYKFCASVNSKATQLIITVTEIVKYNFSFYVHTYVVFFN